MFSYIKGCLKVKTNGYIVIETNGIGYKIFMSETSIEKLGEIGSTVKVHTYLKVREDDISLFGFNTNEELHMFELLISVGGIGAKSAITILSNITPSRFALAVITNEVNTLKKLPGIGSKSAQRIILELKDKLKTIDVEDTSSDELKSVISQNNNLEELISALQVLGYTKKEVEKIIPKLDNKDDNLEILIKKALLLLSK